MWRTYSQHLERQVIEPVNLCDVTIDGVQTVPPIIWYTQQFHLIVHNNRCLVCLIMWFILYVRPFSNIGSRFLWSASKSLVESKSTASMILGFGSNVNLTIGKNANSAFSLLIYLWYLFVRLKNGFKIRRGKATISPTPISHTHMWIHSRETWEGN